MPIYVYRYTDVLDPLDQFCELMHSYTLAPLIRHPENGRPLVKCITIPNLSIKHTQGTTSKLLEPANLKKHGFQKYQRKHSGGYEAIIE